MDILTSVLIASIYRFRPIAEYTLDGGTSEWLHLWPLPTRIITASNASPGTLAVACSWSVVETASGVICACLPTLRPLVKMATTKVNMGLKSRSLTVHRSGTEYIAMGDSHFGSDSVAKPGLHRSETDKEASHMYPGEEEVDLPRRSGSKRVASYSGMRPPTSDGPKDVPSKHANDEIMIQTEITVSITSKDSTGQDPLRPWEIVATNPGRAI